MCVSWNVSAFPARRGLANTILNFSCVSLSYTLSTAKREGEDVTRQTHHRALRVARFTLQDHPPTLLLFWSFYRGYRILGHSLCRIFELLEACPRAHAPSWTSQHEVIFPGSHLYRVPRSPISVPSLGFGPRHSTPHSAAVRVRGVVVVRVGGITRRDAPLASCSVTRSRFSTRLWWLFPQLFPLR